MCAVTNVAKKMFVEDVDLFPAFLACYNFGRGLFTDRKDSPSIVASREIMVWKIVQDELHKKDGVKVLFDGENYIIEWHFDYVLHIASEVKSEIFFFHWKGMNALKGVSPLPSDRNLENAIVERIYQWGEPPVFFHLFSNKLVVLSGKEEDFNPHIPHLLLVRGEVLNEVHLFEVPFSWKSFRSKAIFFLVVPDKKTVYIWYGLCVNTDLVRSIKRCKNLYSHIKNVHSYWEDFQFVEIYEGEDTLLNEILGETKDYFSIKEISFTPKLFYLLFNNNDINPVEVKNPLRAPNVDAPFPFLQTHLYSAAQPGELKKHLVFELVDICI